VRAPSSRWLSLAAVPCLPDIACVRLAAGVPVADGPAGRQQRFAACSIATPNDRPCATDDRDPHRGDADHRARSIEQRTAAVAGVDGGVRLHERARRRLRRTALTMRARYRVLQARAACRAR
jgi:hypothetical protein